MTTSLLGLGLLLLLLPLPLLLLFFVGVAARQGRPLTWKQSMSWKFTTR